MARCRSRRVNTSSLFGYADARGNNTINHVQSNFLIVPSLQFAFISVYIRWSVEYIYVDPSFFLLFVLFFLFSNSFSLSLGLVVIGFVHLMPSMLGGDIGCSHQPHMYTICIRRCFFPQLIATHKMISLLRWLWLFSQYFKQRFA